jgi:hypothetical protein
MDDGSRGGRDVGFVQSAFMCQRQQQNTFAFLLVLCTQTSHEALRRFSAAISFATNAYQYLAFLCFCLPPIDLGSALHIYGGLCECYHKEILFFLFFLIRTIPRINWLTHSGSFSCAEVHE